MKNKLKTCALILAASCLPSLLTAQVGFSGYGDWDVDPDGAADFMVVEDVSGTVFKKITPDDLLTWFYANPADETFIFNDSATAPPLRITARSSAPSAPAAGDVYLDDGTNTTSGEPGLRRYTGAAWELIGASTGQADLYGENLLIHSESFEISTGWEGAFPTTCDLVVNTEEVVSPGGGYYAEKMSGKVGGTQVIIRHDNSVLPETGTYTLSAYCKTTAVPDSDWVALWVEYDNAVGFTYFDITNGVVGTRDADHDDHGIVDAGNGWYRCWVSFTGTAADTERVGLYLAEADGDVTFTDSEGLSFYATGAQLNRGPLKNYMPTGMQPTAGGAGAPYALTADRLRVYAKENNTYMVEIGDDTGGNGTISLNAGPANPGATVYFHEGPSATGTGFYIGQHGTANELQLRRGNSGTWDEFITYSRTAPTVQKHGGSTTQNYSERWYEEPSSGTDYLTLQTPNDFTASYTLTWPIAQGGAGTYMKNDGSGNLSWDTPAGSGDVTKVGTPVDNQIGVWTGDGTIEGDANFTWSGTSFDILGHGFSEDGGGNLVLSNQSGGGTWVQLGDSAGVETFTVEDDLGVDAFTVDSDGDVGVTGTLTVTTLDVTTLAADKLEIVEQSSDPADPAEGRSVIWQSDGTGFGDDGDIVVKITAGGVTKTTTLVDFSAIP